MDFAKSFSFVFEDPDWVKKVAIAALVLLIPLLGVIVVMGWMLEITRNVIMRDPRPLPDLRFGEQLTLGLRGLAVGLGYALPVILFQLPIIIGSNVLTDGSDTSNTILLVISVCCGSLIFLYSLLLAVILPAAYGNFVAQNRVGAAFQFNQVTGLLRANPGAYLLVLVGIILAGLVAQLGVIACVVGVLFTLAYSMAVQGHLYGQAYLAATQNQAYQ